MSNFVQPKQQHPGAGISAILKNVFLWKRLFLDVSTTVHCGSPDASL